MRSRGGIGGILENLNDLWLWALTGGFGGAFGCRKGEARVHGN